MPPNTPRDEPPTPDDRATPETGTEASNEMSMTDIVVGICWVVLVASLIAILTFPVAGFGLLGALCVGVTAIVVFGGRPWRQFQTVLVVAAVIASASAGGLTGATVVVGLIWFCRRFSLWRLVQFSLYAGLILAGALLAENLSANRDLQHSFVGDLNVYAGALFGAGLAFFVTWFLSPIFDTHRPGRGDPEGLNEEDPIEPEDRPDGPSQEHDLQRP